MKHDWKKEEKRFYFPPAKPESVEVPEFGFFAIRGQANPDSEEFAEHIGLLYALSYAVKMSPKKGEAPEGYFEYPVYPLEGVWDFTEEYRASFEPGKGIDKDRLAFDLMIRQPPFVTPGYAASVIEAVRRKTKEAPRLALLEKVRFEAKAEGLCVQMTHIGPYVDEPASFLAMEAFAAENGLRRLSKTHREIYMSDPGRTAPEKLKTVLRFRAARAP